MVPAGGREGEPNAVAAHAVVACEQGRMAAGADLAPRVGAALHTDDDLHDVPGHTPHHRVVRVVDQVALDRHDDQAVGSVADTVDLAEDPGDGVGGQVDVTVATGEAAAGPRDRGT